MGDESVLNWPIVSRWTYPRLIARSGLRSCISIILLRGAQRWFAEFSRRVSRAVVTFPCTECPMASSCSFAAGDRTQRTSCFGIPR
jgi:hypothetical protein